MGEKTKEQLLSGLLKLPKMLGEKVEHQDQTFRQFQVLTDSEGLFSQIIDYCPYPIVVFTTQGTLKTANNAFTAEAGISYMDVEGGKLSIFQCISNDIRLNNAVRKAFAGKTCFLDNLNNPLSGSSGTKQKNKPSRKNYQKAIVFPIFSDDGDITHGVAVFMI